MKKKQIQVLKTARYYCFGKKNKQTKNVWFILHGYGQDALQFGQPFENFAKQGDYIISVEGLSRFYNSGYYGKVGASWMTSEDRENDIADNIQFLKSIYSEEVENLLGHPQIHLLGFSQGVATLSRFIAAVQPHFQHFWICAGDIPKDLNWNTFTATLENVNTHIVLGNADPFITPERGQELRLFLSENKIKYQLHIFDGGHEMRHEILQQVRNQSIKA